MPLPANSPEFVRLATRWLDGTATAVEARQLWESVMSDVACAREFADQARFELLLQDTLRERLREQGIVAGARQQTVKYQRRTTMRRVLAVAAVAAMAGYLLWLILPADRSLPVPETAQVPSPAPVPRPPAPHSTMVLMARQDPAKPAADTPPDPLNKQLDQFFLTGVDLDKVPLNRALKQLEDQLRELNFANKAELAALHVLLPPGAGTQPVTFHSGSISFLKAVRALAALAGYDVNADDTSVSLLARSDGNPLRQESRSLNALLAQLGVTPDPTRSRLMELFNDARSLGLPLDTGLDENGNIVALRATPGQFEALALMAQSRDQIRGMPPMVFYMRASHSQPGTQNHIFTGPEAERERAEFDLATGANRPVPIIVPLQEFVPSDAMPQGVIMVVATPVGGDKVYLSVNSSTKKEPPPQDPQQHLAAVPPPSKDPIVALLDSTPRGGGEVIKLNVGSTGDSVPGVVLVTSGSTLNANTTTNSTLSNAGNNLGTVSATNQTLTFANDGGGMTADAALQALARISEISDGMVRNWVARILTVDGSTVTLKSDSRAGLMTQLELYRTP